MPAVPWLARPCSPARVRLLCADAVRQTEACCLTVACALPRSYQCGVYPGNYSRFTSDWTQVYQTAYTPTIAPLPWFSVFGAHTLQEDQAVRGWESFVSRQLWDPYDTAPAVHGAAARAPTAAWAGCSADDVTLRRAGNHDIVINGAAPARAAHRPAIRPPPPPRCSLSLLRCMLRAHRPVSASKNKLLCYACAPAEPVSARLRPTRPCKRLRAKPRAPPPRAGSVQTQIAFDTSGASPVSAASPLPGVSKLWNLPAQYYLEDYNINGVCPPPPPPRARAPTGCLKGVG